jgi:hypothetical protein
MNKSSLSDRRISHWLVREERQMIRNCSTAGNLEQGSQHVVIAELFREKGFLTMPQFGGSVTLPTLFKANFRQELDRRRCVGDAIFPFAAIDRDPAVIRNFCQQGDEFVPVDFAPPERHF